MREPLTIVDVGVRGGPHPRWLPFADSVKVYGIDADAEECKRLNAQESAVPTRYFAYALGRYDGQEATLHVTRQPGCSSILKPNDKYLAPFPYRDAFEVVKSVPVRLTSLDTLCSAEGIRPQVVKLDTQGSELDILQGGAKTLKSTLLVETEVEFNPLYEGQPLFGDVDAYLRTHGFALLGLRRDYWRRRKDAQTSAGGTLVHGDALFYRLEVNPEDLPSFALALAAYGQADFVHALGFPIRRVQGDVPKSQRLVGRLLAAWQPHRVLRRWLDNSRPAGGSDWHDPDFF